MGNNVTGPACINGRVASSWKWTSISQETPSRLSTRRQGQADADTGRSGLAELQVLPAVILCVQRKEPQTLTKTSAVLFYRLPSGRLNFHLSPEAQPLLPVLGTSTTHLIPQAAPVG